MLTLFSIKMHSLLWYYFSCTRQSFNVKGYCYSSVPVWRACCCPRERRSCPRSCPGSPRSSDSVPGSNGSSGSESCPSDSTPSRENKCLIITIILWLYCKLNYKNITSISSCSKYGPEKSFFQIEINLFTTIFLTKTMQAYWLKFSNSLSKEWIKWMRLF